MKQSQAPNGILKFLSTQLSVEDLEPMIQAGDSYDPWVKEENRPAFRRRLTLPLETQDWGEGLNNDDAERVFGFLHGIDSAGSPKDLALQLYAAVLIAEGMGRKCGMYWLLKDSLDSMARVLLELKDAQVANELIDLLRSVAGRGPAAAETVPPCLAVIYLIEAHRMISQGDGCALSDIMGGAGQDGKMAFLADTTLKSLADLDRAVRSAVASYEFWKSDD